jgi:hypothetical protein
MTRDIDPNDPCAGCPDDCDDDCEEYRRMNGVDAEPDMGEENGEREGCVLGDKCVCPHPYHDSSECASAEDMEAWLAEGADA